jgi:hypothetical protein
MNLSADMMQVNKLLAAQRPKQQYVPAQFPLPSALRAEQSNANGKRVLSKVQTSTVEEIDLTGSPSPNQQSRYPKQRRIETISKGKTVPMKENIPSPPIMVSRPMDSGRMAATSGKIIHSKVSIC